MYFYVIICIGSMINYLIFIYYTGTIFIFLPN